jgi:hypothetical protein
VYAIRWSQKQNRFEVLTSGRTIRIAIYWSAICDPPLRTVETSVVTFAFFHPQIAAARRLKSICFVQGHSNFLFFSILIADSQADARTHQTRIGFNNASTPNRQSFGHVYTQYHCHPIFTVHAHYFYLSTCAACSCWYAHRDLLIALLFPCILGRILDRSGFMLFRSSQENSGS